MSSYEDIFGEPPPKSGANGKPDWDIPGGVSPRHPKSSHEAAALMGKSGRTSRLFDMILDVLEPVRPLAYSTWDMVNAILVKHPEEDERSLYGSITPRPVQMVARGLIEYAGEAVRPNSKGRPKLMRVYCFLSRTPTQEQIATGITVAARLEFYKYLNKASGHALAMSAADKAQAAVAVMKLLQYLQREIQQ